MTTHPYDLYRRATLFYSVNLKYTGTNNILEGFKRKSEQFALNKRKTDKL